MAGYQLQLSTESALAAIALLPSPCYRLLAADGVQIFKFWSELEQKFAFITGVEELGSSSGRFILADSNMEIPTNRSY